MHMVSYGLILRCNCPLMSLNFTICISQDLERTNISMFDFIGTSRRKKDWRKTTQTEFNTTLHQVMETIATHDFIQTLEICLRQ